MSSQTDSVIAPALAAPVPRRGRMPIFQFFRTLRDNMIATYGEEAYERDIIERKMFGRSRFLINQPAAIKHVLLDNAANYRKTEITRRILEPGLGRGLITSEGETWRHHRRTIAREALADDTLAGRHVPRGSAVLIAPWVLHRHLQLWPNPGRFDPERFSPEQSGTRARFSYLPFGGGRRICIGAAFATAEATLLLAT